MVVNDRWCKGAPGNHGDYYSSEYKDTDAIGTDHPWEESRGVGGSYGFNRAENLDDYQTSKELIVELIDIVSRGGNLLLNVGPTSDGRIPVIMQQRLTDIGDWLMVNGDAIYGTYERKNHKETVENIDVYFTEKENSIFAIFTGWPEGIVKLNLEKGEKIKDVSLLGFDGKINWNQKGNVLELEIPVIGINQMPCLDAWSFRLEK
nr:alpha-L-fucosidase [Bacteroidota bacterium]